MNIVEKAKQYAISCHKKTNHLYDGQPYELHLKLVYDAASTYANLIPESEKDNFLAAAWVHDVIEDCRETYNDVVRATNKQVADLAYALTNEKGKSRKERANDKYYAGIRSCPYAALLKVCDRMANLNYSIMTGSRMAEMYARENSDFIYHLYDHRYATAFDDLTALASTTNSTNK